MPLDFANCMTKAWACEPDKLTPWEAACCLTTPVKVSPETKVLDQFPCNPSFPSVPSLPSVPAEAPVVAAAGLLSVLTVLALEGCDCLKT